MGDALAARLEDAAHTPGGHAPLLALPESEGEVAWVLREAPTVLAVGAQSSLTGGATPFGEWLLGTERLDTLSLDAAARRARAGAGVALSTLVQAARGAGLFYPPVPTFRGAFVGGTLATNAAGAATFKYGSTRAWVEALCVVLPWGEVLEIERGQCRAHAEGRFEIVGLDGRARHVPLPGYLMPAVVKISAGYHAAPGMDLVDLFVGSEGTLGVVTEALLRLAPEPAQMVALVPLRDEAAALALTAALRDAAHATWAAGDARGVDVAAIESLDRRSLELLREEGADRAQGLPLPDRTQAALVVQLELAPGVDPEDDAEDSPLARFARLVSAHASADELLLALPGDTRLRSRIEALREAVPEAVNRRVGEAQRTRDARVHKVASDMIVPFEALSAFLDSTHAVFARRGLDHAVWGHVSDGNLHANLIPRGMDDVHAGEQALLELGARAIELGGCPLSEHGVGRSRVKQELLRRLYGEPGLAQMRAVKTALDPEGRLAPGVLFPRS